MSDLDLNKEYNSVGESVHDLFDSKEEGFYVPLYQREYTWEEDNINQLFEDIVFGIRELASEDGENTSTFLGTVILTDLVDKSESVVSGEVRAQPTAVRLVIDGQQRISTISLLSIQLLERLKTLIDCLPNETPYSILVAHYNDQIDSLTNLHAIRLGRGAEPSNKPKLIRARDDKWTYQGEDSAYGSPVARFTARYIRESTNSLENINLANTEETTSRVHGNIELINKWLEDICDAHIPDSQLFGQFPTGQQITIDRIQTCILGFSDHELGEVISRSEVDKEDRGYIASAVFSLFLFTYYLLRRSGVNRIQPTREDWGFDMFQSLNATGTPLTALETFKPQVMQSEQHAGNNWLSTPSCGYIEDIEKLIEATRTNEGKNSRTNDLLRSFALCYEGRKLGGKFSAQRRWMSQVYEQDLDTIEEKREYVKYLAQVAAFYSDAWYMEDVENPDCIRGLDSHPEGKLASFLVKYLKDANSKLSAPILTRYYQQGLEDGMMDEFVEASKVCAAFFTLWRSSNSTSGLDSIYRQFFSGSSGSITVGRYNWKEHHQSVSSSKLKEYFRDVLNDKDVYCKEAWSAASERFLLYTEVKTICRFVLFIAGHDRTADSQNPGLTLQGTRSVCPLLNINSWNAKAYKSLEHIAPRNPPDQHRWDTAIYSENRLHEVGNLLLLPSDINNLVDRKGWDIKYLYYCYVGRSIEEKQDVISRAESEGINLSSRALKILKRAEYSCAVDPILTLEREGPWDAEMIQSRTAQIKDIAWETLVSWLD